LGFELEDSKLFPKTKLEIAAEVQLVFDGPLQSLNGLLVLLELSGDVLFTLPKDI